MIKLALLGVVAAIVALQFKENNEYGIYTGIVVSIIIVGFVISKIEVVLEVIQRFEKYVVIDMKHINLLLKMLGITYIAEVAAAICSEAGFSGISKQIQIGGKFTILAISMPVVLSLLDIINALLQ